MYQTSNSPLKIVVGVIFTIFAGIGVLSALLVFIIGAVFNSVGAAGGPIDVNGVAHYGQDAAEAGAQIFKVMSIVGVGIVVFVLIFGIIGIKLISSYNKQNKQIRAMQQQYYNQFQGGYPGQYQNPGQFQNPGQYPNQYQNPNQNQNPGNWNQSF
jgi:hypothetical protein